MPTREKTRLPRKHVLEQLEPMEVVQYYMGRYHKAMEALNVLPPSIEPHASGHIIEQIEYIKKILDAGYAYESEGSVYFDVPKFNKDYGYGKLSGRNIEELLATTRELDGQSEKHNPADFALWKKAAPEHIMHWPCALERRLPRLAPRVLDNEREISRRDFRHPRWWHGPQIPPS